MATATKTFTASGSWTAPGGVTLVKATGFGGGGGGGGGQTGATTNGGAGGGGSIRSSRYITVTPGTQYDVTIPAAAAGGSGGVAGTAGGDVTFAVHAGATLETWHGASGGNFGSAGTPPDGGSPFKSNGSNNFSGTITGAFGPYAAGAGGFGSSETGALAGSIGADNYVNGLGGAAGGGTAKQGGAGGGGGPNGNGGAGGNGGGSATGGSSAAANTGAGGGGGGSGGGGTTSGGNGGTGQLTITWDE